MIICSYFIKQIKIEKLSRRVFFVQGKIPNPPKQPAYIKNSWLRQF